MGGAFSFREMSGATTMTIDLEKFCSCDPQHPVLHQPFSYGTWTYATNGHVMVRVLRCDGIAENPCAPNEGASRMFNSTGFPRYKPAPKFELQEPFEWEEQIECWCRNGSLHHCSSCTCKCTHCGGTGTFAKTNFRTTSIGKAHYNSKYISLMQSLPRLKLGQPYQRKPLSFRFDGGEGLLMPCKS
jgi:hypothetical protein